MEGEFSLIKRYFSGHDDAAGVSLGIGDDCALLKVPQGMELTVTTDTLNEGIHFFPGLDPYLLGYKSLIVNLSDLAAMGAKPWCFTLSITLPESSERFLASFAQGLFEAASAAGIALVGGNTSKGPLSVTIGAYGLLPEGRALRRDTAKSGDGIYVTGSLGLSGLYVEAGYGRINVSKQILSELCYKSMHMPMRLKFGSALLCRGISACAIDISDGVVGDLRHILERSAAGAELDLGLLPQASELRSMVADSERRINLAAFGGGDYELMFTVPDEKAGDLRRLGNELNVPVTRIGTITDDHLLKLLNNGKIFQPAMKPFEHF